MPGLALALVLGAAAIHAAWNLVAKQSGGDARFALLSAIAVSIVWAPVGAWFAWQEAGAYGLWQWALLVVSGALHVVYFVTLLRGYRLADLSVVYPVARGTGPLLTAISASFLFREQLGGQGWLGVTAVVAGVVLISGFRPMGQQGNQVPAEVARVRIGILYGALTGGWVAAYTLVDGYAVKFAGISPILVDYLGNLIRLSISALAVRMMGTTDDRSIAEVARELWRPALFIGAISPIAYVMVLFAVKLAPLSHVAPAREVSMLFAAVLGGRFLEEGKLLQRLAGAACIAAGVAALATSRT